MFRSIVVNLHLVHRAAVNYIVLPVATDPASPERSWN